MQRRHIWVLRDNSTLSVYQLPHDKSWRMPHQCKESRYSSTGYKRECIPCGRASFEERRAAAHSKVSDERVLAIHVWRSNNDAPAHSKCLRKPNIKSV